MKYLVALALIVLALTACSPQATSSNETLENNPGSVISPENEDLGTDVFSDDELGNLPPMPED